jgi:putative hemolysin
VAAAFGSLFAAGDAALHALTEAQLESYAKDRSKEPIFRRFLTDRGRVLSRWLVGRVTAIALTAVLFDEASEALGASGSAIVFAVIGAAISYGTFAEIMVSIARRRPEGVASIALRFLWPLEWVVAPVAEPLSILGRAVSGRLPEEPVDSARVTETEVQWVVSKSERAGAIGAEPAMIIRNALDLRDTTVRTVMVPRRKVTAIDASVPLDAALEIVATEGHTRYPVIQGSIDHVIGYLNAKDLFHVVKNGSLETSTVASIMRSPALFVTETQLVAPILREMRAKRLHMAIVTDEFGGMAGVVTLEDVIEEIVGDIRDEYDTEAQIEETPEGRVIADASVSIADLSAHLKREIPTEGDFESLGGLLIHKAGRVPEVGTTVQVDGFKFIVREADETRVVKVEIVRPSADAA